LQTGDATSAIQNALNGCAGKNQVVTLAAGTYKVSSTISVPSGVILRGAASDAASGTISSAQMGAPSCPSALSRIPSARWEWLRRLAQPLLTQDATKESATVSVASASKFSAGDLALVDQTDNSEVSEGDCGSFFKRSKNYGISQRVAIAAVSGSTLTLTTPLHWTFKTAQKAQISRVGTMPTEWAGLRACWCKGAARAGMQVKMPAASTSRTRRIAG